MKLLIALIHAGLGLGLVLYGVNAELYLYRTAQGLSSYAILGIVLGLLSIFGALAFRKEKLWAMVAMPLLLLALSSRAAYTVYFSDSAAIAWTGGIIALVALVLFALFVLEVLYLGLRKKTRVGGQL